MAEDELRERLAELEQQIADLHRGVSVAARADGANVVASGPGTIADAMKLVLSEMRREVPYDSCSVQELRGSRLVIVGGVGFAHLDVIVGESFELDNIDIPNGEVIYRRRPLLVSDTEQYRAFRRGLHVGSGIRSWLGVPLLAGDSVLGMLALDKAESDFYSQEHMRQAMEYASLLGRAMLRGRSDDAAQTA
ncbi:MAG TPA: GAF domain-containing protein [Thermoanaerobaculia bacterium]|jgi:GAF domain-containing protein